MPVSVAVVRYKTRVVSVTVENNRATGVNCADGTVVPASTVVSCADGHTTIFKMLAGRFVNKNILSPVQTGRAFPAFIQVSLGINKTFPDTPHTLSLPLRQPLLVDDQTRHSPDGSSSVWFRFGALPGRQNGHDDPDAAAYDFWINLKKDNPPALPGGKESASFRRSSVFSTRDFRAWRSTSNVPTSRRPPPLCAIPATGRAVTKAGCRRRASWAGAFPARCRDLKDFYMAGHWVVAGGGLPSAALSGRYVAQMICARNGKVFAATRP